MMKVKEMMTKLYQDQQVQAKLDRRAKMDEEKLKIQ